MTSSLRAPLLLGLAAQLAILLAALRHHLAWGGDRVILGLAGHTWLGLVETGGLLAGAGLGTLAMVHAGRAPAGLAAVLRGGALLAIAAAAVPPFLSTDVFDYVLRGRVESHYGANPYLVPAATFAAADPVFAAGEWQGAIMPYGPLTAALQTAIAWICGPAVWLGAYLFKLLGAGALWVSAALLGRTAEAMHRGSGAKMAALWLWNPWLLLEVAGSAHNDGLMALALAASVAALGADRWAAATAWFGVAVLIKHGCAPLGPLLLVVAVRRHRLPRFLLGAAWAALPAMLLAAHYFREPGSLEFLRRQVGIQAASLQHFLALVLGEQARGALLWAGYGVALAALAWAARRSRDAAGLALRGSRFLAVFILVAMPLFSPWYPLWWAPLAALLPAGSPPRRAVAALAVAGPAAYAVYTATRSLDLGHQAWTWACACALPTWLLLRPGRRGADRDAASGQR